MVISSSLTSRSPNACRLHVDCVSCFVNCIVPLHVSYQQRDPGISPWEHLRRWKLGPFVVQPHSRKGRCGTYQRFGRLCRIPKVFLQSFEGTEHHGRNVPMLNLLLRLRFQPLGLDKRSCAAAGRWQVGLSAASVTDGRQAILSLLPSFPRHVLPTSPSFHSITRSSCRSSRAFGRADTPAAPAAAEAVTLLGGVGRPLLLSSTWHTDLEKKLSKGRHRHVRASLELDRRTKARVRRTCI